MTSKEIRDSFKSQTRGIRNNALKRGRGLIPSNMVAFETIEDILAFLFPTPTPAFSKEIRKGRVILRKR
jgi:hypothetical protein